MSHTHAQQDPRRPGRAAAPHDFRAVRDSAEDEEWATDAWLGLVRRGQARVTAAEHALGEVLDLVRSSGEGPLELYGPPDEWARDRLALWAADGSDALHDEPARWRDLPQVAAFTAVGVTLLCGLVCALKGRWSIDWTLAWVLLPLLGPLVALVALTTWEHVVSRHAVGVGAAAGLGVVLLGSGGVAALFVLTNPHPLGHAGIWWHLPLAVGYAALAWLLARVTPEPPRRAATAGPLDDDAWAAELARILRTRGDTTEPQVRRLLDEARDHARHTGAGLADEFGTPAAYAAQVAPRPVVRTRRSALYRTGILALWLWLCWDLLVDPSRSWPGLAFGWAALLCLGWTAAASWREWWRAAAAVRDAR